MSKQEKLQKYRTLVTEIECLEEEKRELRLAMVTACNFDGMPQAKGGHSDPVSSLAVKTIAIQELIDRLLDELIDQRREIEEYLNPLSSEERTLVRLRYLMGLSWGQISKKMYYSIQWLHVIHNRALKRLEQGDDQQ